MKKCKTHRVGPPIRMAALVTAFAVLPLFCSCNVTRTITTSQTAYQKGDTCISIVTKTTEVYDASKKSNL